MEADSQSRGTVVKAGDIVEGRYRIINELGVGSMGSVFLAEHVLIKRRVAIKILRPELVEDADVLDGFMNEARAAGTLGHPNIVECTDMGLTRTNVPYIVLEYIEGVLLTDEIYRVGGLPIRRALKIADRIAAALLAAHNAGIVHRDLKSDNVFLTDKEDMMDVVKVLDFGISRLLGARLDHGRAALVMGTPEFMAPEQVTSPGSIDHRTDIYALGVILYEMLTARRPFNDADPHALLHRVVHDPPPPLDVRDAPPGLEEMLFSKMLAKDPTQRYESMKHVQGALEAFATVLRPRPTSTGQLEPVEHTDELSARAEHAPPPAHAVALPPPARPVRLPWLVAAVVIGAIGGGLMYLEDQMAADGDRSMAATLESDAQTLGGLLDSGVRAARMRVEGIATLPVLRAAIETDAPTLKDTFRSELPYTPRPGEVLEVFPLRDGRPAASWYRNPEDAAPIEPVTGNRTRIAGDGARLRVVVGGEIPRRQGSAAAGVVALSAPIDLAPFGKRIADHVQSATLHGFGPPILLVGAAAGHAGPTTTVAIPLAADLEHRDVALTAVFAAPSADARSKLRIVRLSCLGLSGALLGFYVVGMLRGRKRS
jgi:tRNA A-37 threonylcarbamoyl transferase component Bud32